MQPMWWFALPVLLLPVWWHMRKRERSRTDLLATARFLPSAAPQQQRVPRWSDVLLLLVRLALLAALIAWMAVLAMPWKGDTVFIDPSLESSPWATQQVQSAGMSAAAREPLPADLWNWLARNEHEWRPEARFLILAPHAAMPALPPRLAHATDLRLSPAPTGAEPTAAARTPAARPASTDS
ncbi:MAG TPA: BatA domain-containing protein, partial [Pseudoduganella sp.]